MKDKLIDAIKLYEIVSILMTDTVNKTIYQGVRWSLY